MSNPVISANQGQVSELKEQIAALTKQVSLLADRVAVLEKDKSKK